MVNLKFLLSIALGLSTLSSSAIAQQKGRQIPGVIHTSIGGMTYTIVGGLVYSGDKFVGYVPGRISGEDQYYSGWTSEPLSANNAPYRSIRLSIRTLNKTPELLKKKVNEFKREAEEKPYDPIAQFRWVCADWVQHNSKHSPVGLWRDALARPLSPKTYDYARLRFLITAEAASGKYTGDERLKTMGERLLKIDPKDEFVAYWLRRVKGSTNSIQDKWDNVRFARAQAQAKPKDPKAQAALGGAYLHLWLATQKRSYGESAILQYKKYLQLAPPNEAFRQDAQFWITSIPRDQARWDKQGIGKP